MAFKLPDGRIIGQPDRGKAFILDGTAHSERNLLMWKAQGILADFGIEEVDEPTPVIPPEEQARRDKAVRQANRITTLREALIDQMEMIIELFKVGRTNGVWVKADFPNRLTSKAAEWQTLIDDFRSEDN